MPTELLNECIKIINAAGAKPWNVEQTRQQVQESAEIKALNAEISNLKAINSVFNRG